ncbi:MAG TPA: hypothetical protein VFS09_09230 [Candidatus Eisenbacteria bacterium]|nr:hypothetical protein [Candidatus Eisenbacteria bacterium]
MALAAASALPSRASGQTLKLHALHLPAQDLVGTWVSFHGRSQSRGSPIREFDQRLAVVSKEDLGRGRWGLWVELKTTDTRGGSRVERGLFASPSLRGKVLLPGQDPSQLGLSTPDPESGDDPGDDAAAADEGADLVLVRYQAMNGNKLYEYPVGNARHARSGGEVSSFELFEYDPGVTPIRATIGPDTLRLGRRVVPAEVERVRRFGTDEWPSSDDSTGIQRLVLTQTFWRNNAVPLTGYARSIFRAEMRRIPWDMTADSLLSGVPRAARPDSTLLAAAERAAAQADSLLRDDPVAPGTEATPATLAWTELVLADLGADAKPEIDQQPEIPADADSPEVDPSGYQR